MKNADEMFKELGYSQLKEVGNDIRIVYRNPKGKNIIFFTIWERSGKVGIMGQYEWITMQELKAINEKVKELGWLDDANN